MSQPGDMSNDAQRGKSPESPMPHSDHQDGDRNEPREVSESQHSAASGQKAKKRIAQPAIRGENAWLAEAMFGPTRLQLPDAVTVFVRTWYLPMLGVSTLALGIGALAGWAVFAVVMFVLSTAVDVAGRHVQAGREAALSGAGASPIVRSLARSLLAVILVARDTTDPGATVFFAYLVVILAVQFFRVADLVGSRWLGPKQPMMLYRPGGPQSSETLSYAKVRARARHLSVGPLVVEIVSLIALVAALNFPAATAPAAVVVSLGVIGLIVFILLRALEARKLARRAEAAEEELLAKLSLAEPTALIYMSGGAGQSKTILNQWMPAFERMQQPAIVVVREASQLPAMVDADIPIVYAPRTRHVESLVLPSVQVAFYPANGGKNVHLLREAGIKHVFLNHGDSDKSTSANPFVRVYSEVWVAGQAAVERYAAAGIDLQNKFGIVGRPQVEPLVVGALGHARPTLLYAPTFEGYYEESNYSSLERMGPAMIRAIMERHPELRIWFKPHPATGAQRPGMLTAQAEILAMLRSASPSQGHLCVDDRPELNLLDCFSEADLLISDISSVVSDFLYTERPLIVTNPRELAMPEFKSTFPTQRSSYILERDLTNLTAVLDDALGEDSMAAERRATKLYVLGDLPEGPMEAFTQNTTRIIGQAKIDRAKITNEFRVRAAREDTSREVDEMDEGSDSAAAQ